MSGLLTTKFAVQVALLLAPSSAVIVIVCVPRPSTVPTVGLCESVTEPQLSVATTEPRKLGTVAVQPAPASAD